MVECARQKGANPDSWSVEGSARLPTDVIYEIAAFLSERDICSLEICSRFWHELCSSDFIWFHLFRKRWSSSEPIGVSSFLNHEVKESSQREDCVCTLVRPCGRHGLYKLPHEGWQAAYRNLHFEMERRARAVVEFVKLRAARHESLEVADYQKALMLLSTTGLDLYDVFLFLLAPVHSVLINLIGMHYCLLHLGIQGADMKELLSRSTAGNRQVCLRWWSIGGWANGFRRRDEMHLHTTSLYLLTELENNSVFQVLDRGILHEVLRVQISADFGSSAWVSRCMHSQR
ncbi:unnamed protein product [Sphagnum tenellum]|uniref:F-box domain-containing protein n=1 Tax=Sphagnum jensenii TaxID=128206 RepID=A0ABP0WB26_9BRYO